MLCGQQGRARQRERKKGRCACWSEPLNRLGKAGKPQQRETRAAKGHEYSTVFTGYSLDSLGENRDLHPLFCLCTRSSCMAFCPYLHPRCIVNQHLPVCKSWAVINDRQGPLLHSVVRTCGTVVGGGRLAAAQRPGIADLFFV